MAKSSALNIKDPKVANKARELARLRGKTITAAVSEALDLSIKSARGIDEKRRLANEREVDKIIARFQKKVKKGGPSPWKVLEDMYDEYGLPK